MRRLVPLFDCIELLAIQAVLPVESVQILVVGLRSQLAVEVLLFEVDVGLADHDLARLSWV